MSLRRVKVAKGPGLVVKLEIARERVEVVNGVVWRAGRGRERGGIESGRRSWTGEGNGDGSGRVG